MAPRQHAMSHLVNHDRRRHVCRTEALLLKVGSKLGHSPLPGAALGARLDLHRHGCRAALLACLDCRGWPGNLR